MSGQGQIKGHNEVFSPFGLLGQSDDSDGCKKRSNSPKVLDGCPERIVLKYEGLIYKRSRSKSGHKRSSLNKSYKDIRHKE